MTYCAAFLQYSGAATDPCSRSESGYPFCSSISVKAAEGFDVGMYTCSHAISPHYPGPKNDTAQEEVYVYVKGVHFLRLIKHLNSRNRQKKDSQKLILLPDFPIIS